MSSDVQTLSDDDIEAIEAALVWDVPQLRRVGVPGATEFVDAFGPSWTRPLRPPTADDPVLLIAALGVVDDRRGERDLALRAYDQITGGIWADLLRHALRAWSPHIEGTVDIRLAAALLDRLQLPDTVRSRLSVKLATFAYDKGDRELLLDLLRDAVQSSPADSRLRYLLAIESLNLARQMPSAPDRATDVAVDPLVDRDWIDAWALSSAQEFLTQSLVDQAQDPWSSTIRIGQGPLDGIMAAEIQATWAGAFWQRRGIRKQLGAQLLLSQPRTPTQAAYGLFYWFSTGGQNHRTVADFAEPSLDRGGCDWLMHALASRADPGELVTSTLAQVAAQLWDCISDDLVGLLLDALPAEPGEHPIFADNRRVWGRLAERDPDEIGGRMLRLPEVTQVALLDVIDYRALEQFDKRTKLAFIKLLRRQEDRSLGQWLSLAWLERSASGGGPPYELDGERADVVVNLAALDRSRVTDEVLIPNLHRLAESVRDQRQRAKSGHIGLGGGQSPATMLASGLLAAGDAGDPSLVECLWESALDSDLDGESRLSALAALARLASAGALVIDRRNELRRPISRGDVAGPFPMSADLLRAGELLVLASKLSRSQEFELLALARSRDVRARELAINVAALALEAHDAGTSNSVLSQVVFASLFDPNEGVIVRGLNVLAAGHGPMAEADEIVGRRLVELIETRRRPARAASARAARALTEHGRAVVPSQSVLELAARDKSWLVRRAALVDD